MEMILTTPAPDQNPANTMPAPAMQTPANRAHNLTEEERKKARNKKRNGREQTKHAEKRIAAEKKKGGNGGNDFSLKTPRVEVLRSDFDQLKTVCEEVKRAKEERETREREMESLENSYLAARERYTSGQITKRQRDEVGREWERCLTGGLRMEEENAQILRDLEVRYLVPTYHNTYGSILTVDGRPMLKPSSSPLRHPYSAALRRMMGHLDPFSKASTNCRFITAAREEASSVLRKERRKGRRGWRRLLNFGCSTTDVKSKSFRNSSTSFLQSNYDSPTHLALLGCRRHLFSIYTRLAFRMEF